MKISSTVIPLTFLLLVGYIDEYSAQDIRPDFTNCFYQYPVGTDSVTVIRSPNYPGYYPNGKSCQYELTAPIGYQVAMDCNVDMPQSNNCASDRFDVARSGTHLLNTDQIICGRRRVTTSSYNNRLRFSQVSPTGVTQNRGGFFQCRAWATPGCACINNQNTRIVGGTLSPPNGNCAVVALIDSERGLHCGGTIVAPRTIVTAAHCIDPERLPYTRIRVGQNNLNSLAGAPYAADYGIASYEIHGGYRNDSSINDIAILTTSSFINYNRGVCPACLPFSLLQDDFAGRRAKIYGYGARFFGGPAANELYEANVNVLDTDECNRLGAGRGISVTGSQMCLLSENGDDFCQNDSGGGTFFSSPYGYNYFTGIQSYGYGCGTRTPAVTTRVTSYVNWILRHSIDRDYCMS